MIGVREMSHPIAREKTSGEIYNRAFWLVFVANLFLCAANTLTFRFAEFVKFLGGNEELTGSIVAFGLIASIVWRTFLGQVMDRFGVRKVWLGSTVIYLVGVTMLATTSNVGWFIYAARAIFAIGIASMYASALSFVQGLAPIERRTEIIGTYGASGFLGMIAGAQLGDLLFKTYSHGSWLFIALFAITFAMGAVHGLLALSLAMEKPPARPTVKVRADQLFVRYWPPMMSVVTLMMGLLFAITTVFLTRYATERGISGLRVFFSAYAITAFLMRLTARNWSKTAGRHRLIVIGLASQVAAVAALLPIYQSWHLLPSGICFGFGQALLFPCVISLGAGAFPEQYRGTGTTLTLSAIDLGTVVMAPVLGWVIDNHSYELMLWIGSGVLVLSTTLYAAMCWKLKDNDSTSHSPQPALVGKPVLATVSGSFADSLPPRALAASIPAGSIAAPSKEAAQTPIGQAG